jgi:outer membrane protein assembly factor BamD (BamD/ComL family)
MGSLASRTPWIVNSETMSYRQINDLVWKFPDECTEYRREARERVDGILKSLSRKQNITSELRYSIPL